MSEPTNNSSVELNTPKVGPSAPIEGSDALTASEQKHRPGRNERDGKHMSRGHLILRRFWRPVGSKVGVIGLALVVLLAAIGPYIANWDYWVVDDNAFLSPPDQYHWFGTSQGGFDLFAMTVEGLRKSLIIGFCVALIVETLAALIGSAAAYFGKVAEKAIPWFIDLLLEIPDLQDRHTFLTLGEGVGKVCRRGSFLTHALPPDLEEGSTASRRPSPMKLTLSSRMTSTPAGNMNSHGEVVTAVIPSPRRVPRDVSGFCTPNPKKDSTVSLMIAATTPRARSIMR